MAECHSDSDPTHHTALQQSHEASATSLQAAAQWAKDVADVMRRIKRELLISVNNVVHIPMQGVIGMTGFLLETELSAEQRQYAETVWQAANALLTLLNTTLDISEIEAGECDLATINFEFRTPMQGVIGMTGFLLETELSAEQRQYAETVWQAANALLTLLETTLGFTVDHRDYSFNFASVTKVIGATSGFDLRTVIEQVVDLLTAPAHAKGLKLVGRIPHDLPTSIIGDPASLHHFLLLLVANAIVHTDHGEVVIRAYPVQVKNDFDVNSVDHLEDCQVQPMPNFGSQEADDTVHVRFEVSDTHIGIIPERRVHQVEPLYRYSAGGGVSPFQAQCSLLHYLSQADGSLEEDRELVQDLLETNGSEVAITGELSDDALGTESMPSQGCMFWFTEALVKR